MTIFNKCHVLTCHAGWAGRSGRSGRPSRSKCACRAGRGFTLLEMMVTVSLLSLAMLAIIPTFSVFSKSVAGLGNYAAMSEDSRRGLELISRDIHAAESLNVATPSEFAVSLPADAGGGSVRYKYDSSRRNFTRVTMPASGNVQKVELFDGIDEFQLVYFNKLGVDVTADVTVLIEAKSVQLNAKLVKNVVTLANTDYIISARFLMRNK